MIIIRYDNLPSLPHENRAVIRCHCCHLVQFFSKSGLCVKSGQPLIVLPPQSAPPIFQPAHHPAMHYDFPFAFRLCRIAAGLSQHVAAKRMGVQRTWLSKVECGGIRQPVLASAERFASAYGLPLGDVINIAQVLGEQLP